jgi:hypothetical protein
VGVLGAASAAMLIAAAMQAARALLLRQSATYLKTAHAEPAPSCLKNSSVRPLRSRSRSSNLTAAQLIGRVSVILALVLYPAASRNAISLLNCAEVCCLKFHCLIRQFSVCHECVSLRVMSVLVSAAVVQCRSLCRLQLCRRLTEALRYLFPEVEWLQCAC